MKAAESVGIKAFEYPQPWNQSPITSEELLDNLSKYRE
jgi:hypothetical protein